MGLPVSPRLSIPPPPLPSHSSRGLLSPSLSSRGPRANSCWLSLSPAVTHVPVLRSSYSPSSPPFPAPSPVGKSFPYVCVSVWLPCCLVAGSPLTLRHLVDASTPGSSVHGGSPGENTAVGCRALL